MIADRLSLKLETVKAGKRSAQSLSAGGIQAVWWPEGEHLMLALGVHPLGQSVRVIDGARPNLTAASWYADFKAQARYETDMRGRVDLIVDYLAIAGLESPRLTNMKEHLARHVLLRHFGLHGLTDLTFHLGFDGKFQRSTVRLGVVEPDQRNGLLTLFSAPAGSTSISTNLAELPPLPPDTDYISIRHVNWEQLYDYAYSTLRLAGLAKLFEEGLLQDSFPDLDQLIGGDFRKNFLQQLGTTAITWGGHSEGPFFLGQGFAVKVKDVAKVRKSLTAIIKALTEESKMFAAEKRIFRGKEMYVFSGLPMPISFTLHGDWLIAGLFPHAVQGVLLRSGGKYRAWQSPPEWAEALAKERKSPRKGQLLGMSVSDPRPVVTIGLSLLPSLIHGLSFSNGKKILDVTKIPHAQTINEWLFPNIAFVYDQGNGLCWEHHYSMNEPDDLLLLLVLPSLIEMGLLPFEVPVPARTADPARPQKAPAKMPPAPLPLPEPRKVPSVPPPAGAPDPEAWVTPFEPCKVDADQPKSARASAATRDGKIWINVITKTPVSYKVQETIMERYAMTVVDKNGVARVETKRAPK